MKNFLWDFFCPCKNDPLHKIATNLEKVKILMATLKEFEALIVSKSTEIVELLKTVDTQVEAMFEQLKNPQVPADVEANVSASLQAIKDAAAAVASDDELPPTP